MIPTQKELNQVKYAKKLLVKAQNASRKENIQAFNAVIDYAEPKIRCMDNPKPMIEILDLAKEGKKNALEWQKIGEAFRKEDMEKRERINRDLREQGLL